MAFERRLNQFQLVIYISFSNYIFYRFFKFCLSNANFWDRYGVEVDTGEDQWDRGTVVCRWRGRRGRLLTQHVFAHLTA